MALYNIDLFGGSKANLNWSKLPDNVQLPNGLGMSLPVGHLLPTTQQRTSHGINMVELFGSVLGR